MKKNNSIIYVNYSPYENSGKILDYLLENFETVALFSLGFHNIKKKEKNNKLFIYRKGLLKRERSLFQLSVPSQLVFITLPLRSLITALEITFYSYLLKKRYDSFSVFFSVNAFTSGIGILMKELGLVSKTLFWVWDYYPPIHQSKVITIVRKIYWYFDKWSTTLSDRVVFVNQRLLDLRKSIGIVSKQSSYPVISIGTDIFKVKIKETKSIVLGFIGVIKRSQGLDVIFENANKIIENFPNARFEIVGSGPEEEYFKKRAKKVSLPIIFHGYFDGNDFNKIFKNCTIGIAPYQPDPRNVSHYGDAGKVKLYLSLGLPVIITDVFEFSKEVEKNKAGVIIRYGNPEDLIYAIKTIMSDYKAYQKNALVLGRKFYYKKIYPQMFEF